jgi:hypothetical protein
MSFRYIVVCDKCARQQGVLTDPDKIRNDGGGVYPNELADLGWEEDTEGRHTCPFCANPCPMCGGQGQVDCERPPGTYIECSACDGTGIAPTRKRKGEN